MRIALLSILLLVQASLAFCACDSNTKLMLHLNDSDGSTTTTDSSASAHSITFNGNAQTDTAAAKFGAASYLGDGTGDYLTIPDSADWDFGTGDFTLEMWANWAATGGNYYLCSRNAGGTGNQCDIYHSSNAFYCYTNSTATINGVAFTPTTGTWYHIVFMRSGTSTYLFVDGTQQGSTGTSSDNISSTDGYQIGAYDAATGFGSFNGHLDEVRFSNVARYSTSGFTSPSSEFCQESRRSCIVIT